MAWREETEGAMQVQAVAIRVHWATGSSAQSTSHSHVHAGSQGWLLAERPVPAVVADDSQSTPAERQEKIIDWFGMLPAETSLQRLVLLAHARWVSEQFYEEAKQASGPGHAGLQLSSAPTSHPAFPGGRGFRNR
jgi:SRSO17 transposase